MIRTARLTAPTPLDWEQMIGFLSPRAIPGVEEADESAYRRLVTDGRGASLIEVRPAPGFRDLLMRVHHGCEGECDLDRGDLVRRARRLFGLDADQPRIARALGRDPILGLLVRRRPGLRLAGSWSPFESAVRALLGQQVSVKGATTLAGRLVERLGEPLPREAGVAGGWRSGRGFSFPPPERIAQSRLEGIGMPEARVDALRGLARAVASGTIRHDPLVPTEATPERLEEITTALRGLRGIGPWTANYLAMRVFRHPDAFPAGDLGLLKATGLKAAALERHAERWRPHRAWAAMWLWSGLD
jgi:AraC family transcriptional regulator of adaptative response / DNA-3-methyladenine glycosylase II